jgi:hypothetical protein
MQSSNPSGRSPSFFALVIAAVVFLILVLIGYLLFLAFPANGYYNAMLYTGILAIILALATYLASSLSRGLSLGMAAVGAFWFGIAMLLGADLATPNSAFGDNASGYDFAPRVFLLIIILVIAIVGLAGSWWQSSARKVEDKRESEREQWRRSTGVVAPGETRPGNQR